MTWYMIVLVFMILMGAFTLSFQIYKMTEMDARSRGLKHPKFWGFFSLGGNNGSGGLILYLIGRRNYPSSMNEADRVIMHSRKKKACVSLCFLAVSAIGLFAVCLFTNG